LLKYLDTDSIWYAAIILPECIGLTRISFPEEGPEVLVEMQAQHWQPIIDWAQQEFDVEIRCFKGIFGSGQPAETKDKLSKVLSELDAWELTGAHLITMRSPGW
jgi:ATP synthase mitochondrial F1 complex assembly factor 2